MSKRDAYIKGYQLGRWEYWGEDSREALCDHCTEFHAGLHDGTVIREFILELRSPLERFLTWLVGKLAR